MGIYNFDTIFDELDSSQNGYVTVCQIKEFHSEVFDTNTDPDLVKAAVEYICGHGETLVQKDAFLGVLEEIERRRSIYFESFWDFRALDHDGNGLIAVTDALLLFQEYHGDLFSLDYWDQFLTSRERPYADVCFDEIRDWLCAVAPECEPSSYKSVKQEEARLEKMITESAYLEFNDIKTLHRDADLDREEQEERSEELGREARQKLNRWKVHGIASLLNDDGHGPVDDMLSSVSGDSVTTIMVLDALDMKYTGLQDKVIMEMASFAATMDSEKAEVFQQIKRSVVRLSKEKTLAEQVQSLPGGEAALSMTLLGLMGDLPTAELEKRKEFDSLGLQLEMDGLTPEQTDKDMAKHYKHLVDGPQLCGDMLVQLSQRYRAERDYILSSLTTSSVIRSLPSSALLAFHYLSLLRQLRLLQSEPAMTTAGLAVGIAERSQKYKPKRYDWDRERSEILAGMRIEGRKGHKPMRRSINPPELDNLHSLGSVALKARLVDEMEQRHFYEREAMIYILQGHDSKASIEVAAKMTPKDRQRRLRTLRNQHEEWKAITDHDQDLNHKLLQEAAGLYFEERRAELEQVSPNISDALVMAAVLADLQQRQEVEFDKKFKEVHTKTSSELKEAVLREIEATKDEHFSNVAYVLLGCMEISVEDAAFIRALEGKYKALRDQILLFGLKEKMGSNWNSLSKEDKQREILQYRKEEKRLRREGQLEQMSSLIGTRSQALPSLLSQIGDDKTFLPVVNPKLSVLQPLNILADLVPRYDSEQDSLLSWLHAESTADIPGKVKHIQITRMTVEKFAAVAEGDHEGALLFVGLLERINSALSGRSKGDRDKQLTLAQKRASRRKKCLLYGEKLASPPEEKATVKDGDERTLQEVYLRALLRRHYKEREILLSILQEEGLDELVEAAVLMSPDESNQRIRELKAKRDGLDLDDKFTEEEHRFILEETGALRCAGKKKALTKDLSRTAILDEVVTHILMELQDLQDAEIAQALGQLVILTGHELQEKISMEEKAKKNSYCHLVMKVFTKFDGESSTGVFEELLNHKYRSLRDQLLTESLVQTQGKHTWEKMGQKQKSKLLTPLANKESALWDQGDSDALSALLPPGFTLPFTLPYLSGLNRPQYMAAVWAAEDSSPISETETGKNPGGPEAVKALHGRYLAERDFIRDYVAGDLNKVPSDEDKQLLQSQLNWEAKLVKELHNFTGAAVFVGLAERQSEAKQHRLQHDPERYKLLARQIMSYKREQVRKSDITINRAENLTVLQLAVMTIIAKKHQDEWNVLQTLMNSTLFKDLKVQVSTETELQKAERLTALAKKRAELDLSATSEQLKILDEACMVKIEYCRELLTSEDTGHDYVADEDIQIHLISCLVKAQLSEADISMRAFQIETTEDLIESQETLVSEISQSHVTNIAHIIFTREEEEDDVDEMLKKAVDGKYDAMKDHLLIQALINEMGEAEWSRLSEAEKQRLLLDLKLKEKRLRKEGRFDEARELIGDLLNSDERLRQLLGETKEDQEHRLREKLERRKQRLAKGLSEEECDQLEEEDLAREEEEDKEKKKNILLYLEHCHDKEKDELLRQMQELENEHERQRRKQAELLKLRREQRQLREEGKLDAVALLMGLSKENDEKNKLSKDEEKKRQQDLARQRLESARQRHLQEENLVRGESIILPEGEHDDYTAVSEAVLKVMDRRHQQERNLLIKLLDTDVGRDEERDQARVMTDDEIRLKMEDVLALYNLWGDSETRDRQDGEVILRDASVLCIEAKKRDIQTDGELASDEDVKIRLVADLQVKQEQEAEQMMNMLLDVDDNHKKEILNSEKKHVDGSHFENVSSIILAAALEKDVFDAEQNEENDQEKLVMKALEKKYDAMKDKLLIDALIKQMGEAEWNQLSKLESQRKIIEMKQEERRLRHQGKLDEIAILLGQAIEDSEAIDQLLGQSEEDQKRRTQEKLAMRKKLKEEREAQGLNVDDETLDQVVEEEDKKIRRRNILETLNHQYEDEKTALLAALRGHTDKIERERHRQLALAKLQRDQRRLKKEEKFDAAVLLFAQRQEADLKIQHNLENERERHRQLAKERLAAIKKKKEMKNKKNETSELTESEDPELSKEITDDLVYIQDSIQVAQEKHMADERNLLMSLVSKYGLNEKKSKQFEKKSDQEIRLSLSKMQHIYETLLKKMLKNARDLNSTKLPPKKKEKMQKAAAQYQQELMSLLEDAMFHKFELEKRKLASGKTDLSDSAISEELLVTALADLQEKQQTQLESIQDLIENTQDLEKLKEFRRNLQFTSHLGFPALASVLLQPSDMVGPLFDQKDQEKNLEKEYEKEKAALIEKGQRENMDIDAMLKQLEDDFSAKRQALLTDAERQRQLVHDKLIKRKQAAEDLRWNTESKAGEIIAAGKAHDLAIKSLQDGEKGRQTDLFQQKLQALRNAKRQAAESAAATERETMAEGATGESIDGGKPSLPKSKKKPPHVSFGLSRERTVVDVDVSDEKKQAMYDQLVKQNLQRQQQISAEQARQEQLLKEKLEARSTKREHEVAALFSLGERQKTVLERSQKDERDRQIAQMKERVTKIRESRSKSPGKPTNRK